MASLRYLLGVVWVLVAACGSESAPPPKPPDAFSVFPNLPVPPGAQFVSRAGSEDALQLTLYTPTQSARVVEYYRGELSRGKWRLVSDMKKPNGTIVLYAEQDGPPLWVSVWPTSDSAGTMVQLAGAVRADSAKPAVPKPQAAGS
jgi:hypothetical protein